MADYHRFVAYIYEYINGKKVKNAGFAKIELRNAICRIQIHIQNAGMADGKTEVSGIVRKSERQILLLIGEGKAQGNEFDRRFTVPEEPFVEETYRFDQICGIYIESQSGRKWMTVFDDEPIEIDRLEKFSNEENVEENLKEISEDVPEPEIKAEEITEQTKEAEIFLEEPEEMIEEEEKKKEPEKIIEEKEESEDLGDSNVEENPENSKPEKQEPEEPISCRDCKPGTDTRWNRATAHYVHFNPVEDEEIEDAIRIQPSDLKILWQKGLRQGSNSFLMHGFYQHQHLMIGKNTEGGYVLGVPGFYGEKNMAEMFGFPKFRRAKTERKAQLADQTFGYWCKYLE